jgi:hypothetical protein
MALEKESRFWLRFLNATFNIVLPSVCVGFQAAVFHKIKHINLSSLWTVVFRNATPCSCVGSYSRFGELLLSYSE